MFVSTRAPSGKWKVWVKWLVPTAMAVAVVFVLAPEGNGLIAGSLLLGATALWMLRYRLSEQRLDLLLDRRPVRVTLYKDLRLRIWIDWSSAGGAGRNCIGQWHGAPVWLDHDIELEGKRYSLRIFAQHYPDGFMLSNYGQGFEMVVIRNSYCL